MLLKEVLETLAKRLESRIRWHNDGYYDDDAACARNAAIRETLQAVADECKELALHV